MCEVLSNPSYMTCRRTIFLQLEYTPEYGKNLNSLCLEIIRRDEKLQQSIGPKLVVNSVDLKKVFKGVFNKCRRRVHKAVDCRKPKRLAKQDYHDRRLVQVTIDANKNKNPDIDYDDKCIEYYICHARGDYDSTRYPNGTVEITSNNWSHKNNELKNGQEDAANPSKKHCVA